MEPESLFERAISLYFNITDKTRAEDASDEYQNSYA